MPATRFIRENLVRNLPDAYNKGKDSNNRKLLDIEKSSADWLRESIQGVYDSLDLDAAYGKTLDLYGDMLGQDRGKANDDQYRILIKTRIARNLAGGDYNGIMKLLSMIFGCSPSDFRLIDYEKPCTARIDMLPFEALNKKDIAVETAIKIIKEIMPAGVQLESVEFTGTFEFSDDELEYDENKGFADDAQTIGGYLGYIFYAESDELPV